VFGYVTPTANGADQIHFGSKHVLADLRPYICLVPDCTCPVRDFEGRRQWARHILSQHWRAWTCVLDCGTVCESADEMRAHFVASHVDLPHAEEIDALVEMSEGPKPRDIAGSCPLCQQHLSSLKEYARHVGRHQKDLSLFALPKLEGESQIDSDALNREANTSQDQDSLNDSGVSDPVRIQPVRLRIASLKLTLMITKLTGRGSRSQLRYAIKPVAASNRSPSVFLSP